MVDKTVKEILDNEDRFNNGYTEQCEKSEPEGVGNKKQGKKKRIQVIKKTISNYEEKTKQLKSSLKKTMYENMIDELKAELFDLMDE